MITHADIHDCLGTRYGVMSDCLVLACNDFVAENPKSVLVPTKQHIVVTGKLPQGCGMQSPQEAYSPLYIAGAGMQPGVSASRWGGGLVAVAAAEPSLRQLVEHHAAEHNIEFLPKVGRRHEGLQARCLHPYS